MTIVKVFRQEGHIVRVSAVGHTGYADEGEDIVCSALSSVMQTAILGLVRVAALDIDYKIIDSSGSLELALPENLNAKDRNNADMILDTMLCGIADLHESYSRYIKLEVKN